jgi:fucose permease
MGLIALVFIAFISLGLPDGLMGVAWPSIRTEFGRPLDSLGLILIAAMAGYLTSSFFSGRLLARLGVGGLLAASCCATGLGLIGYTLVPSFEFIVALAVVAGLGGGAIDAGLNTYVAANHGEGMMQWLHAFFGVGVTLGPIIMTAGLNNFESWRVGYLVVGSAQILLALCFLLSLPMWKQAETDASQSERLTDYNTPLRDTLSQPRVWLSILIFFAYVGVEATLGQWVYTFLTEGRGIPPEQAGLWAGSYWGTFTVGRVLAGFYTRRISGDRLVRLSLGLAFVGAVMLLWSPIEIVGLLGVGVVGFAIAPIFAALVSGTAVRVGVAHAANTIGMQMSAAGLGIALMPSLAGVLARRISLEIIPWFLLVSIVLAYALYALSIWLARRRAT